MQNILCQWILCQIELGNSWELINRYEKAKQTQTVYPRH